MKQTFRFIPQSDHGKELWLGNFAAKLPIYAAKYNITNDEVNDVVQSSEAFSFWRNVKNQHDELNKKLTDFKNELRDGLRPGAVNSLVPEFPVPPGPVPVVTGGIFARAASIAYRIKKHIAYMPADGKDLGIETVAGQAIDVEAQKPVIKARLVNDGDVEIKWVKKSMDRIEIHVDRGEGYAFLAYDTHPDFIDENFLDPGQTAIWDYKAIYIKNDKRVGMWSDKVTITVTGKAAVA